MKEIPNSCWDTNFRYCTFELASGQNMARRHVTFEFLPPPSAPHSAKQRSATNPFRIIRCCCCCFSLCLALKWQSQPPEPLEDQLVKLLVDHRRNVKKKQQHQNRHHQKQKRHHPTNQANSSGETSSCSSWLPNLEIYQEHRRRRLHHHHHRKPPTAAAPPLLHHDENHSHNLNDMIHLWDY